MSQGAPHLKKLKIKHPRDDNIRLELLMKYTHQLETLVLEDLTIKVNPNHPASYPLKHLKLNATSVSKNLDVFLARTCPHLRTLQLFNSVFPKSTFSLPNVHLSHLKIIKRELPVEINPEYANDDANYMLVKTQEWQHLYFVGHRQPTQHGLKFFDRFDLPAYPTSKYYPYDALSRTPHIAFEFASVGHVDTATKWKVSEFYFY
jgi:hypothetical protein